MLFLKPHPMQKLPITLAFAFIILAGLAKEILASPSSMGEIRENSTIDQLARINNSDLAAIDTENKTPVPATNESMPALSNKQELADTTPKIEPKKVVSSVPAKKQNSPSQASVLENGDSVQQPVAPASNSISIINIIANINIERSKKSLSPITENSVLNRAAYNKSKDMSDNNYFAHTAPNGKTDLNFIQSAGYRYAAIGINLAEGDFDGANGLVQAWMNSSGHRDNILAAFGKEVGIGISGKYYTMIIGKAF